MWRGGKKTSQKKASQKKASLKNASVNKKALQELYVKRPQLIYQGCGAHLSSYTPIFKGCGNNLSSYTRMGNLINRDHKAALYLWDKKCNSDLKYCFARLFLLFKSHQNSQLACKVGLQMSCQAQLDYAWTKAVVYGLCYICISITSYNHTPTTQSSVYASFGFEIHDLKTSQTSTNLRLLSLYN